MTQPTATVQLFQLYDIRMDRTVPASIQTILSDKDWCEFCDQIDIITKPLGDTAGIFAELYFIILCSCWPCYSRREHSPISKACQMENQFLSDINTACEEFSKKHLSLTIHHRTRTTEYGRESRRTDHYFDIFTTDDLLISGAAANGTPESEIMAVFDAVAVEVPSGSADQVYSMDAETDTSPAYRMRKLDQLKEIITEKEYEAKRNEILSSV